MYVEERKKESGSYEMAHRRKNQCGEELDVEIDDGKTARLIFHKFCVKRRGKIGKCQFFIGSRRQNLVFDVLWEN